MEEKECNIYHREHRRLLLVFDYKVINRKVNDSRTERASRSVRLLAISPRLQSLQRVINYSINYTIRCIRRFESLSIFLISKIGSLIVG